MGDLCIKILSLTLNRRMTDSSLTLVHILQNKTLKKSPSEKLLRIAASILALLQSTSSSVLWWPQDVMCATLPYSASASGEPPAWDQVQNFSALGSEPGREDDPQVSFRPPGKAKVFTAEGPLGQVSPCPNPRVPKGKPLGRRLLSCEPTPFETRPPP